MFPSCPKENMIIIVIILVSGVCQDCAKSSTPITWISWVPLTWDISYQKGWIYSAHIANGFRLLRLKAHSFMIFRSPQDGVFHICSRQIYLTFLIKEICFSVLLDNIFVKHSSFPLVVAKSP